MSRVAARLRFLNSSSPKKRHFVFYQRIIKNRYKLQLCPSFICREKRHLSSNKRNKSSCVTNQSTHCSLAQEPLNSASFLSGFFLFFFRKQNENQIYQRGLFFPLHVTGAAGDWKRPAGSARHRGRQQGAGSPRPTRPGHPAQGLSVVQRVPPWSLENPVWGRFPHHHHKVQLVLLLDRWKWGP